MYFVNLKWKKRDSTDHIYVVKRDLKGVSTKELRTNCYRKGNLDLGYHFVVRANGTVDEGRPEYTYAGWWFDDDEHCIAILVDTPTGKISASQKKAIEKLAANYPDAKIEEVEVDEKEEM